MKVTVKGTASQLPSGIFANAITNEKGEYFCAVYGNTAEEVNSQCTLFSEAVNNYEELKKQNEKLIVALEELLPLADSGYKNHSDSRQAEEFLKQDRTLLLNARQILTETKKPA